MSEIVQVKFDGGIAAAGQLHFYEYGRSQYALARFIATIEHFRRTGEVAEKITSATYVELLVSTPTRGSFVTDILIDAFKDGTAELMVASFGALFAYAWHRLVPRREKTEATIIELAKLRLQLEQEKTAQARERTKQVESLNAIVAGERASTGEALELLKWSQDIPQDISAALDSTPIERADMVREVEAKAEREEEFSTARGQLEKIDETEFSKLTSRLRAMVYDMTLPLKRSATRMSMGAPEHSRPQLAHITSDIVKLITAHAAEEDTKWITGRVKSYDRDSGVGKVKSKELPRVLNFIVPLSERQRLRDFVLVAMQRDSVSLEVRRTLDESGNPTSLALLNIELGDDEDEVG